MSSIKTTQIDGDVSVGRNVAIGGKADIAGSVSIGHNLKVDGWLEAPNIKGINKGVYARESALLSAYPSPQSGWFAGVGETSPFALYMVEDGAWYATGGVWTPDVRVSISEEEYASMLSMLSGKVDKEVGKGLSSEDFTSAEKKKLAGLQNYDDRSITGKVTTLEASVSSLGTSVVSLEAREGKLAARVLAHNHGVPEIPGNWATDEDTTTYNYYHTDLLALPNGVYTIGETGWAKVFKYLDGTLVDMEELTLPYTITVSSLTVVGEQPFDAIRVMRRVPIDVAVPTDGMPVYVTGVDYNILDFVVSVIATHPQIRELLSGKQDAISDLAAIRSGARAGASAYQLPEGGIPIEDLDREVLNELQDGSDAFSYIRGTLPSVLSNKQNTLTFDNVPTQGSTNPVTSGGVHTALTGKVDKVPGKGLSEEDFTQEYKSLLDNATGTGDIANTGYVDKAVGVVQQQVALKQDKVAKVSIEFSADNPQAHEVETLSANTIAEVTFVDYIDFILDSPVAGYKTEYCFTFDVDSAIPTLTLPSDIVWAEELELEANSHYVILINYENGIYYGDWKSYPITSE